MATGAEEKLLAPLQCCCNHSGAAANAADLRQRWLSQPASREHCESNISIEDKKLHNFAHTNPNCNLKEALESPLKGLYDAQESRRQNSPKWTPCTTTEGLH